MNRIQFGRGGCEKTLRSFDAYISNELTGETNHDVVRHLEACPACSAELETRTRLRSGLKAAVKKQGVPPELQVRIREQIRTSSSDARLSPNADSNPAWAAVHRVVATCKRSAPAGVKRT